MYSLVLSNYRSKISLRFLHDSFFIFMETSMGFDKGSVGELEKNVDEGLFEVFPKDVG